MQVEGRVAELAVQRRTQLDGIILEQRRLNTDMATQIEEVRALARQDEDRAANLVVLLRQTYPEAAARVATEMETVAQNLQTLFDLGRELRRVI